MTLFPDIYGAAQFSPCRAYRYWLTRRWNDAPLIAFICANPSVADESANDPTIRKQIGFARRWRNGGILALNVAAFCSTDPHLCAKAENPVGPENTVEYLHQYISKFQPEKVIAAWGNMHPRFKTRCDTVHSQIPNLWCFGTTISGNPKHPSRLGYSTLLRRFPHGQN
jgi:hypothetical protein